MAKAKITKLCTKCLDAYPPADLKTVQRRATGKATVYLAQNELWCAACRKVNHGTYRLVR